VEERQSSLCPDKYFQSVAPGQQQQQHIRIWKKFSDPPPKTCIDRYSGMHPSAVLTDPPGGLWLIQVEEPPAKRRHMSQ
jgi:hypothetical protein